jgi:hypothetical protein
MTAISAKMGLELTVIQQMGRAASPMVTWCEPIPGGKLPFEMMSAGRVELKQEQMRFPTHASRDLAPNPAHSRSSSRTNELEIATIKALDCSVIIRHLSLISARLAQW